VNLPFREVFLTSSLLEKEILQKQLQELFVGVSSDILPVLCPNLKFNFDHQLQHTFFHEKEKEQVVKYGWNQWKGVGWVLVIQSTSNPYMFGHLSQLEKNQVGFRIRKMIIEGKKWSYKM